MSFTIVAALVGTSIGGGLVVQEKADKYVFVVPSFAIA